jgi:hypothetical protein
MKTITSINQILKVVLTVVSFITLFMMFNVNWV